MGISGSIDVIVIIKYNQDRKQKFADAYILNKKEKLTTGRFRRAGKQLKDYKLVLNIVYLIRRMSPRYLH